MICLFVFWHLPGKQPSPKGTLVQSVGDALQQVWVIYNRNSVSHHATEEQSETLRLAAELLASLWHWYHCETAMPFNTGKGVWVLSLCASARQSFGIQFAEAFGYRAGA